VSPRTSSVVSTTCEPKPTSRICAPFLSFALLRASVRLLPTRAPRQAVLRASSRLASWLTTRPCDLPADKTRDAYDRLLPPERLTCTRTSCVPDSLPRLSPRGRCTESKAPYGFTGGPGASRHPRTLRRIDTRTRALLTCLVDTLLTCSRAWAFCSHGARCDRASDTPVATPSPAESVGAPSRSGFRGRKPPRSP